MGIRMPATLRGQIVIFYQDTTFASWGLGTTHANMVLLEVARLMSAITPMAVARPLRHQVANPCPPSPPLPTIPAPDNYLPFADCVPHRPCIYFLRPGPYHLHIACQHRCPNAAVNQLQHKCLHPVTQFNLSRGRWS